MMRRLGWLLSLLSLAAVVWWASQQQAPTLPASASTWAAFIAAIALYCGVTAVRAERWLALLRHSGATPARGDAHALLWVGYMGNTVLPARAGDAMRAVFVAPRSGSDVRLAIGTLIAERLLDVAVLAVGFGVLVVVVAQDLPTGSLDATVLAGLIGAGLVAVVLAAVVLKRATGVGARVRAAVAPMVVSTRRLRGGHGVRMVSITIVIWLMELSVWWLCAVAADLGIGPLDAAYVLGISAVAAMVPAAPGQAGTMDAAVLLATAALDRPEAAALGYLLLLRFVLFVPVSLVGLVLLVTRYGGLARMRAARQLADVT